MSCDAPRGIEDCAGDRTTHAPTVSKPTASGAPQPTLSVIPSGVAFPLVLAANGLQVRDLQPGPTVRRPATLISLSVLLQI